MVIPVFTHEYELQSYIANPANYKPVYKKEYPIWADKPELGTVCNNLLLQEDTVTSARKPIRMKGLADECWAVTIDRLMYDYKFLNGQPITEFALREMEEGGIIKPFKVGTVPDMTTYVACFVPAKYSFSIETSCGNIMDGNLPNCPIGHGKGDFILATLNSDGSPNFRDRWIINGYIFARTFKGWADPDCLDDLKSEVKEQPKL